MIQQNMQADWAFCPPGFKEQHGLLNDHASQDLAYLIDSPFCCDYSNARSKLIKVAGAGRFRLNK
jgi:hypothetical protein